MSEKHVVYILRNNVDPRGDNKIILFVTENKGPLIERSTATAWQGSTLRWEGPTDHFGEERMLGVPGNGDEIHVFYRREQRDPFTYLGQCHVATVGRNATQPSSFELKLV